MNQKRMLKNTYALFKKNNDEKVYLLISLVPILC